MLQILNQKRSV